MHLIPLLLWLKLALREYWWAFLLAWVVFCIAFDLSDFVQWCAIFLILAYIFVTSDRRGRK